MRKRALRLDIALNSNAISTKRPDLDVECCVITLEQLRSVPCTTIEDQALVALALRPAQEPLDKLLTMQILRLARPPNAHDSALSAIALSSSIHKATAHEALNWLTDLYPAEAHWLWKWKFRLVDRGVAFDPAKFGWPWNPGTVSWVGPTAIAMLAFKACGVTHSRVALGAEMLLDRACPSGGWNAGNSVVLGVPLDPHPDFTAMALLALRRLGHQRHHTVIEAVDYLARRLSNVRSAYSLAWGIMALAAFDHPSVPELKRHLANHVSPNHRPGVLALASLALETPTFTFQEYQR